MITSHCAISTAVCLKSRSQCWQWAS